MHSIGMIAGWLIPILFIVGVVYFFRNSNKKDNSLSAKEILTLRYAKGEIEKKEYEEKLKEIESQT